MTSYITISFSDIIAAAHADLALIAKRLRTKDGNLLFQNLTVSSVEDAVLKDYARQGAMGVLVKILKFVQGISDDDTEISFRVSSPRLNNFTPSDPSDPSDPSIDPDSFATLFASVFSRYVVDYVLYEYLAITVPADALPQSFAERYVKDMGDRLAVINELLSHKEPSSSPQSFDQNTGSVEYLSPSSPSTPEDNTSDSSDNPPFSSDTPSTPIVKP